MVDIGVKWSLYNTLYESEIAVLPDDVHRI